MDKKLKEKASLNQASLNHWLWHDVESRGRIINTLIFIMLSYTTGKDFPGRMKPVENYVILFLP